MSESNQQRMRSIERSLVLRQKQNPYKYFTPNGKLTEFIKMVGDDKTFISLFSGANGTSKTSGSANIIANIMWANSGNKYFNHKLYKEWDYPKYGRIVSDPATIQQTIVPELEKWFPKDRYYTEKKGKNYPSVWHTDTGWTFDVMTYEQAPKDFESKTLGWAWFDEPPPYNIFKATVMRMRLGGIIFIGATPLLGSAWMYDHIMNYNPQDADKDAPKGQRDYLYATIEDNCKEHGIRGFLEHKAIVQMLAEYTEEELQPRAYGKFHHLTGMIFKNWNPKVHVLKPFKLDPKQWCVIEALDPHGRNPDMVNWLAFNKKGDKIIVDELSGHFTTQELAQRIQEKADRLRVEYRICDPIAFVQDQHQDDPESQTLAAKLYELGIEYQPAPKERTLADRMMKDAFDYEMKGQEMIMTPELYVFGTCTETIWQIEHYQWDEWQGKAAERKDPNPHPMKKREHAIENIGRQLVVNPEWVAMEEPFITHNIGVIKNFDVYE